MGFFSSIKDKINGKEDKSKYLSGFSKTNNALGSKLRYLTKEGTKNTTNIVEQLMIILIESDIGYQTSQLICDKFLKEANSYFRLNEGKLLDVLLETIYNIYYEKEETEIIYNNNGPTVILMVGVNGAGKTSSCAKLAKMYKDQGKKVCLAAADTFRAGAIEQLKIWADKVGVDFVSGKENEDPSSVLVNACRYAKDNDIDILLCDTAGRLQTKANLMSELAKMRRVVGKEIEGAPHNVWLVIDGNTGQNGLSQATLFNESTELTGIILTKMDGTSKGGIVIAIKNILGIPVRYVTLGENVDDIREFDFYLYLYSIIEDVSNAA